MILAALIMYWANICQGNGYVCDLSFSPHHASTSFTTDISGPKMHYNFHPGNGRDQPAMVTAHHEKPSHRNFSVILIRGFVGTGFLESTQQLSHVVKVTDMSQLEAIQVHDCSHCHIVIELAQVICY